ncbi:hypothetical protein [Streptomyces sp. NPDC055060]
MSDRPVVDAVEVLSPRSVREALLARLDAPYRTHRASSPRSAETWPPAASRWAERMRLGTGLPR